MFLPFFKWENILIEVGLPHSPHPNIMLSDTISLYTDAVKLYILNVGILLGGKFPN
jgi:hypothetical protein